MLVEVVGLEQALSIGSRCAIHAQGRRPQENRRVICEVIGFRQRRALLLPFGSLRSEEHTSELQSLMRISYAVFCLKNKKNNMTSCSLVANHGPVTTCTHLTD